MSKVESEFSANEKVRQAAREFQVAVDTSPASSLYSSVAAVHGAGQYQLRPDVQVARHLRVHGRARSGYAVRQAMPP